MKRKKKLLVFSYLFVPLLFLGMGEKERQRKQIKNRLIMSQTQLSLLNNSHKTVQKSVSRIETFYYTKKKR